ncbi:MAG: hybrid sensor histidine kinase/response regulator [Nostocaceae cyanobacterium]|nr:hybrid sensor histidine kinase/response regulator [Nostocaceae cyanobacterium]
MKIEDEQLRDLYKVASADHIQKIEAGLLHLEQNPQDQSKLEVLLRETHSLKGDSRMLGVKDAETLTHQMEEILTGVKRGERVFTSQVFDCLYKGLDAIRRITQEAVTGQPSGVSVFHVLAQLMAVDGQEMEIPSDTDTSNEEGVVLKAEDIADDEGGENIPTIASDQFANPLPDQLDTIRVESKRLDKLLTQAGELLVTKAQVADWLGEIDKIISLWEQWNREANVSRLGFEELSRRSSGTELQPVQNFYNLLAERMEQLGAALQHLRNRTFDNTARLETVTNELESGIRSLRLLPLSTIFNVFPRTVRDLAKQQGKQVKLIVEGGETYTDKRILEEMKDPLLHLLRNAIDHGIETTQERQSLGKPPRAIIRLRAYQTGNTVTIEVSDDGRGLDLEAIKQAAVRRGIRSPEQLNNMPTSEIQALIFASGFSTRTAVTEISGRGVGLDVVRANVERLKGTIEVEFTPGQGCLFRITLNNSMTTTNVLLVQLNQTPYAIPVEFVDTMLLVSPQEIFASEGSQTLPFAEQSISVVWLADLLGLPVKIPSSPPALRSAYKSINCVILRIDSERLALLVDDILEQQDIVLKPQSQLLKRVRNISGATILGTGQVCMVLNPVDLFKSAKKTVVSITVKELAAASQVKPKILLVEDSIPIRTQMKRILSAAGYEVTVAQDGEDGWEKLQNQTFAAVISDVEMPNLDGLGLTAKIRKIPEYKDLPVILVTTLATEDDKRRGTAAGANAYITKGDFEQELLLDTLRSLI